eukprot:6190505-Pleurochrysis_carterae.AAC.1
MIQLVDHQCAKWLGSKPGSRDFNSGVYGVGEGVMICKYCTPQPLGIGGDLYTETYDYYELRDLRLRGPEGGSFTIFLIVSLSLILGNIGNISYRDILMASSDIEYLVAILEVPKQESSLMTISVARGSGDRGICSRARESEILP